MHENMQLGSERGLEEGCKPVCSPLAPSVSQALVRHTLVTVKHSPLSRQHFHQATDVMRTGLTGIAIPQG